MHTIEGERLSRQARRVNSLISELESMSETISGANADTETAPNIGNKQTELQNELEQLIIDAHHVLEHSEGLQNEVILNHPREVFSLTHDESAGVVTVSYSNSIDLSNGVVTIYKNGSEASTQFGSTLTDGASVEVSVSEGDSVRVEWETTKSHDKKWMFPNGASTPITDTSNLPEPEFHEVESQQKSITV